MRIWYFSACWGSVALLRTTSFFQLKAVLPCILLLLIWKIRSYLLFQSSDDNSAGKSHVKWQSVHFIKTVQLSTSYRHHDYSLQWYLILQYIMLVAGRYMCFFFLSLESFVVWSLKYSGTDEFSWGKEQAKHLTVLCKII